MAINKPYAQRPSHVMVQYIQGGDHPYKSKKIVHLESHLGTDYSICGLDLAGDSDLGWEAGEQTDDKVTCPHCIALIDYIKSVKDEDLDRKKSKQIAATIRL